MRESRRYLQFFTTNLALFLVPMILLGVIAFIYQQQAPVTLHHSLLLQMDYDEQSFNQRIVLADQAVTITRSEQLQDKLGVSKDSTVVVYKSGPVLVTIDSSGQNSEQQLADLNTTVKSLQDSFPMTQVGNIIHYSRKTSEYVYLLIGIGFGFLVGLLAALTRTYFQKY